MAVSYPHARLSSITDRRISVLTKKYGSIAQGEALKTGGMASIRLNH